MQKTIPSLEALAEEARQFLSTLARNQSAATLVTLSGELGAGKTAFTKEIARALGIAGVVNSPTFVLEKIYDLPAGASFSKLVHIDAYRLGSGAELAPTGFAELMKDPGNLILLEWPENVADVLPVPTQRITLVALPDGSREISYG